jgi:energy-coupling factor transporter ATP-binding protein EcfA2
MKITNITIKNFIGARSVDLKITRPIALICGSNGSGKSSIAEAVRMALVGEPSRVSLKKEYRLLITEGQTAGYAVVKRDGETSAITLPNGAHEHTGKPFQLPPYALNWVLDPGRLARVSSDDRRAFLFGLMGLRTDGPAVTERLLAKGCNATKAEEISPHLRSGFAAAHKEAQSRARDAKASWRAITGDTYGSIKAGAWSAPKPEFDANRLRLASDELAAIVAQIEERTLAIGDMQGRAKLQATQSAKISGLRERAKRFAAIESKLRKDQADLAEWQAKVDHETTKVGKRLPNEQNYNCPSCGAALCHDRITGNLVAFTPPQTVDAESAERLLEYERARDLLARSVENDKRDLNDADSAAKMLGEIGDAQEAPAPAPEEIQAALTMVKLLKDGRAALQQEVESLKQRKRQAAQAEDRTDTARSHHADVAEWEAIAEALAPNGIPGEMLNNALGPINERLAASSNKAEWLRIGIDADMNITGDGKPYYLLSESERWRADAMIAEAISHLSGVKVLLLDRVDVLAIAGRDDLLYWLDSLVTSGHVETALLFATLKSLPEMALETVGAAWVDRGTNVSA